MLVSQSRPRNLKWFHAGPLLYGDWGTSRLYVLGLAFFFTGQASVFYLVAIGLLMVAVAWAYTIICRSFPDGGGVYAAARQLDPTLSVIGATLLLCGYLITVGISVVEALHYFGVPDGPWIVWFSAVVIGLIGIVNWLGARSAARFAMIVAIAALAVSGVMVILCLPYLAQGFRHISLEPALGAWPRWTAFTQIVLALAGVEAVANMTGMMKKPVQRTARRTIWPVLIEVVVLNILFGIAMTGMLRTIPELADVSMPYAQALADPNADLSHATIESIQAVKNTAMEVLAQHASANWFGDRAGQIFGKTAAVVFALLLLSATNTAIMAMVSVFYAMAQDKELPRSLAKLNYSGVPRLALIISCLFSIAVIMFERRPEKLAELYIIGVCGAITVSVASVAVNRKLDLRAPARVGLWILSVFLAAVFLTIVATKTNATVFAVAVVCVVLITRQGLAWRRAQLPPTLDEPLAGWLAEVKRTSLQVDPSRPKIMLAARGRYQAEFAVDLARRRNATLFVMFVRTLRVMDVQPGLVPRVEEDPDAQRALGTAAVLARQAGVPFVPIYVTSSEIASEILDYTVTHGCDTVIMGKSRRSLFARKIEGDVVMQVAEHLPDEVALITRSADTPHLARPGPDHDDA
ncbi:MAG: amino acid permease [Planctomycetes bacterium]|nr:amino acid permease [Planctomycetota bacterium]